MREVAGVQHEGRLRGCGLDLCDRSAQRRGDIGIRGFVEADVAVADLHELKSAPCPHVPWPRALTVRAASPSARRWTSSTRRQCRPTPYTLETRDDRRACLRPSSPHMPPSPVQASPAQLNVSATALGNHPNSGMRKTDVTV